LSIFSFSEKEGVERVLKICHAKENEERTNMSDQKNVEIFAL